MALGNIFSSHTNINVSGEGSVQAPGHPANFIVTGDKDAISRYSEQNGDLIIEFTDGKTIIINGFFANGANFNNLIFIEGDSKWQAHFDKALGDEEDGIADTEVYYEAVGGGEGNATGALLAILGATGAAVALGSGSGSGDSGQQASNPAKPVFEIIDDTSADGGIVADGAQTNDTTPTFRGSNAVANGTITINIEGYDPIAVNVDADGTWVYELPFELANGEYPIVVTQTDSEGNVSEESTATIIIDTATPLDPVDPVDPTDPADPADPTDPVDPADPTDPVDPADPTDPVDPADPTDPVDPADPIDPVEPAEPVLSEIHDNLGPTTGLIIKGDITDDARPLCRGTADPENAYVEIFDNGNSIAKVTIQSDGSWSWMPSENLADGSHSFSVRAVDKAGNTSSMTDGWQFTVGSGSAGGLQTVEISEYADNFGSVVGSFGNNTTTDDRTPTLNGTLSIALAAGETLRIYSGTTLLGTATVNGLNWTFETSQLDYGKTYALTAIVENGAGNKVVSSDIFTVSVDSSTYVDSQTTADTTPLVTGVLDHVIGANEYVEVTISGVTYDSRNGEVSVDKSSGRWSVQISSANALAAGPHDVTAALRDASGNVIITINSSDDLTVVEAPRFEKQSNVGQSEDWNTAITIGEDGSWRILTNSTVFTQTGTDYSTLGSFSFHDLTAHMDSTFIDFDRDGLMDILGVSWPTEHVGGQHSFKYDGTDYTDFMIGSMGWPSAPDDPNSYIGADWSAGTAGIDINGDGYVDVIYGQNWALYLKDDISVSGYDTSFVLNTDGTIAGFDKSGAYVDMDRAQDGVAPTNTGNAQPASSAISGVDLNNDGYVDIVYGTGGGTNTTASGGSSSEPRLVIVTNGVDAAGKTTLTCTQIINGAFSVGFSEAIIWADLNGDGFMDMFTQKGPTVNHEYDNTNIIRYNDGHGNLVSESNGVGAGSNIQVLGDDQYGSGASLAFDWNCDGRMDLFNVSPSISGNGDSNGMLWENGGTGVNGQVNWTEHSLLSFPRHGGQVTGAVAIDLDYDGDQDLTILETFGADPYWGQTNYVENTTQVAAGTSIILRILDKNGINAFYGNTVVLVDDATGEVVSTQIINAQMGVRTNNSTGLVYFYGLDAAKSYSAVLLSNGSDYGGVSSVTLGGSANAIENVSVAWAGLKPVAANHAYVLTAESGAAASGSAAATDDTNTIGIVGTGYNDTLYATAGTHVYNGGGGAEDASGKVWSNTGGQDIIDYELAGNKSVTVDLSITGAQNTGFGTQTLKNIEGVAGGSGNDTLRDNDGDNIFEGRGGNDFFFLTKGGNDTLLYQLLDNGDGRGGNGQDTVHGFTLGSYNASTNADRIDISGLLINYQADADGAAHFAGGVATIDAGDTIASYLSLTHQGGNTILHVDRDGQGSAFGSQAILTLVDTNADLATLLANQQIVV